MYGYPRARKYLKYDILQRPWEMPAEFAIRCA